MRPATPPTAEEPVSEPAAASNTATHCPYCSLQCAMQIVQQPGKALGVKPSDFPSNRGTMCQKGWTSAELSGHPERLTTPLVRDRRDAELRPASWDQALDRVAGEPRGSGQHHGRDAVGVFGGGGLTNEKALPAGQVRACRPAQLGDRLQRAFLHVLRPAHRGRQARRETGD